MTRSRWAALSVVLVALVAAVVYGSVHHGSSTASPQRTADLASLRTAAALTPCPASVGALAPLSLPCLGGGPAVQLAGAGTGRPTVVNVYGSWCAPCQAEYSYFVALSQRHSVDLVGVDTEDTADKALKFARDTGQHWPSLVDDDGTVMRRYAPGPPVTLFLDAKGALVGRHIGGYTRQADLDHDVQRYLGVPA